MMVMKKQEKNTKNFHLAPSSEEWTMQEEEARKIKEDPNRKSSEDVRSTTACTISKIRRQSRRKHTIPIQIKMAVDFQTKRVLRSGSQIC